MFDERFKTVSPFPSSMRLEEYLTALKECPDEELKDELGVYDNFPIFLRADFYIYPAPWGGWALS